MRLLDGLRVRVERLKLTRRGCVLRVGEGAKGPRDGVAREPGPCAAPATGPGARASAPARLGGELGRVCLSGDDVAGPLPAPSRAQGPHPAAAMARDGTRCGARLNLAAPARPGAIDSRR
jgi:hypothetical protein